MLKPLLAIGGVIAAPIALYVALGEVEKETRTGAGGLVIPEISVRGYDGKELFAGSCGACHGIYGEGSETGPTLIHVLYAPGEMSDDAIRTAIRDGAEARNWPFGDMPAIPQLTDGQIDSILVFLREVQVANEIN